MMSSRVQMTSLRVSFRLVMRDWALSSQTFVPWERPDILMRSSMFFGLASMSMPRTKFVPNSGMPSVPVLLSMSSGLTFRASTDVKRLSMAGSFSSSFVTSEPR